MKSMYLMKIFEKIMESQERLDAFITINILIWVFYCFLWDNNLFLCTMSIIIGLALLLLLPKPNKKNRFLSNYIKWQAAWLNIPPYSKLIDWFFVLSGLIISLYGTWNHEVAILYLGILINLIGILDFLIRFGYKKTFEKKLNCVN